MKKLIKDICIGIFASVAAGIILFWWFQPDVFKAGMGRINGIIIIKTICSIISFAFLIYAVVRFEKNIKVNQPWKIKYREAMKSHYKEKNELLNQNETQPKPFTQNPLNPMAMPYVEKEKKNRFLNTNGKEGEMNIIGKKVVVKIGGEPPKDDPNEIVGEKTILHVPDSEIGKYNKIVGLESKLIIGGEDKIDLQYDLSPEQIFPGKWRNTWSSITGLADYEIFEIRNKKEYHVFKKEKVNGKYVYDHHRFNIEITKYNGKEIIFTKYWVNEDHHPCLNTLQIISQKRLEGKESNGINITYTREE